MLTAIYLTQGISAMGNNVNTPQIINFNKHQYGGANKNWSVDFDHEGYTYFGNSIGLLEFDGVSWNLHPSPNGFAVRAIAIDQNNRIYTGGYREIGYWERNKKGKLEYFSLTEHVEKHFSQNEEFWHIFTIGEKVFFQSFSGIYIYSADGFEVINIDGFITHAAIIDDQLLIALKDRGVFKIVSNKYVPHLESDFFSGKTITFISDSLYPGEYLIGTESNGIYRYNISLNKAEEWAPQQTNFFIRNNINNGVISRESSIIIGSILGGIKILDKNGNEEEVINVESGLQSNTVHALACDSLGNIWVASDKGLDFISFSSSDSYSVFQHKELGSVYSAALYNDVLYAGTNQGLFRRPWGIPNKPFSLVPGTQRQIWNCNIIDDKLFVGHNSGTFIIDHQDNHKAKRISNHAGAYSITPVPEKLDHLIQSTYTDLVVYSKENGQWNISNTIKGFSNLIRFLEFDHRDNLWASHLYHGVYKIRLNETLDSAEHVTYFGKGSAMWRPGTRLRTFKVENRIVFTNKKQLFTYDDLNDSIVSYDFLNENLGEYSTSFRIVSAPGSHYWFINSEGIALFKIRSGEILKINEFPISLFSNNLIPQEENIIPIDSKKALLCLENGYAILDAGATDSGDRITSEALQLREVSINDQKGEIVTLSPYQEKITIPYNQNNLALRYSFPLYSAETIRFQYKIDGLTEEWSAPAERPEFIINRIPKGDYIINVRATNNWQKSSAVHELKLTVNPPWYQSKVAIAGYALFFAGLFFLGKHITIQRVKLNEKHKREEKEHELVQLRNENLRSELSFKSRQLANSTLGMVKKNEFLMSLKEKLKRQKEQLGIRYPDKYYKEMISKIDTNISGDDEWKLFEHNFNQAHETFLQTLKSEYPDLTPSDLRLCAFLRINLTSKEIAPLLGISVRGVENHRYRVRKKLNLSADTDLTEFILTLQNGKGQSFSIDR